jgi:hypothetical protein
MLSVHLKKNDELEGSTERDPVSLFSASVIGQRNSNNYI